MEQEELYNHCMKSDNPNSILAEPLLDTEVTKEKSKDNRKILRFWTKLDKYLYIKGSSYRKLDKLLKTWPNSTEKKEQMNKTLNGINELIIHINKTILFHNKRNENKKCETIIKNHIKKMIDGLHEKIDDKKCKSTFTELLKNNIIYLFLKEAQTWFLKYIWKAPIQKAVIYLKTGNFRYTTVPFGEKIEQLTEHLR